MPQAVDQETGASEQQKRKRHLRDYQSVAQRAAANGLRGFAAAFFQGCIQIDSGRLQRRHKTKQDAARDRNECSEAEDSPVESNLRQSREVGGIERLES